MEDVSWREVMHMRKMTEGVGRWVTERGDACQEDYRGSREVGHGAR